MKKPKLTKELVFVIKNSGAPAKELATKYAVSVTTVRRARKDRRFVTI